MNKLIEDLDAHSYHTEDVGHDLPPMLSASTAQRLLLRSPLHAWLSHPRLGGLREESTDAMENGSLIHALVLGAGPMIVPVEADSWRTNVAKEAREKATKAGKIAVLAHKLKFAENSAAILKARMESAGIRLDGESEVSAFWEADGVQCRGRFDHLCGDDKTIVDVKSCDSAHPNAIQRSIENYGYDVQCEAYRQALETIRPELAGAVRFLWCFIETVEPYAVTVVEPDPTLRELGTRRWARALATWKQCLATKTWPAYATGIVSMAASEYAIKRETTIEYDNAPAPEF